MGCYGVFVRDNENVERALKRFKKACDYAGVLSDLRKYRNYEKPSETRKRKINAARRKNILKNRPQTSRKRRGRP